jgi:tetratricopeptide (TPR) repeat protein
MVMLAGKDAAKRTEELTQRLVSHPDDREALRALFELHEARAAAASDTAEQLEIWNQLAEVCRQCTQTEGVVNALERARALAPSDVRLSHALAAALLDRSAHLDEAGKALDLDRVADLLCDVALVLPPDEARKFLISALGHAPWHARALYELESMTPEAEKNTLAAYWVAYLAHNPEGELAQERRVALARAYIAAGQFDDAAFALEPAARSGFLEATRLLSKLRLGSEATRIAPVPPAPDEPSAANEEAVQARERRDTRDSEVPPHVVEPASDDENPQHAALRQAIVENDSERLIQLAEELLDRDPSDGFAFGCLEKEFRRKREHKKRAELLLASAERSVLADSTREQRLREAITLFEQKLSDPEGALRAYHALSAMEPDNEETLRGMSRMLERCKRWEALAECIEKLLRLTRDPAQHSSLLWRLVELQRRDRGDHAAAAETLQRLVDLDPNDRAARLALTDELTLLERWDELARLLERRANEPSNKAEQIGVLRQLAGLFEGPLQDVQAAFEAYERIALLNPEDAQALTRMEEIDDKTGDHERLLRTLGRRLERAPTAQAVQLLPRMAAIAEKDLLDQERAHGFLKKAFELAPDNPQAVEELASFCERNARYEELLSLLGERARAEKQAKARAELYRRMARILAGPLQDEQAAANMFESLNDIQDDHEAHSYLEAHARKRDDKPALAEAQRKLADLETEPKRVRERLLALAETLTLMDQPINACEALSRVLLQVDADDAEVRQKLSHLCEKLSDFRPLARPLEELLQRETVDEQRALRARELADLCAARLSDDRREQRALDTWTQAAPDDPEPWRRLAKLHERAGRGPELLIALDSLARIETDATARAEALLRAAELCAKRQDTEGTLARVERYAREVSGPLPESVIELGRKADGLARICTVCEATGRFEQLCAVLRERADQAVDPKRKAQLCRQLATASIEHLQDEQAALLAYEDLLSLVEDLDALRFVQGWATAHDDPKRLADTLGRLARIEQNPTERRDLWMERGRIVRAQLNDPRSALAAFEEALLVEPDFEPALDELLVCAELAGDHARQARTLEHKIKIASQPPDDALMRLADLYEGPLNDDGSAIDALQRWAARQPQNPVPLRRLRAQFERTRSWQQLLSTLDALATCESEQAQRVEATVAAAELAYRELSDASGAIDRLKPLVPLCDPTADRLLGTIAEQTKRMPELYAVLEDAKRYADLAFHLERAARRAHAPGERAAFLRRAADVLRTHLNDVERTSAAYSELLTLEEDVPALRFMQARALESGDAAALAEIVLRLSKLATDPRELRDLLYDYAHVQNFRLRSPAVAIPALHRILTDLDPQFEPALDEMLSAAEAADDPIALAFALTHCIERETELDYKADMCGRLADVYELGLQDNTRAIQTLQLWSGLVPDNIVPLLRLRRCYERENDDPQTLLQCLDRIAVLAPNQTEQREAALAAALLCAGKLEDVSAAFTRLVELMRDGMVEAEDALRKLAFEHDRLEALSGIFEQHARFQAASDLLAKRAQHTEDLNARIELLTRRARLLAETIGDEIAAAQAYRELLELRELPEALQYLCKVAEQQDDIETLERCLARLAPLLDANARPALTLRRSLLLRDRLSAATEACALLEHLLDSYSPHEADAELRERIINELETTAEQTDNRAALAQALEARLTITAQPAKRRAVALHLADLCEAELGDLDRAAVALRIACAADPRHLGARRRLKAHLARQNAWREYVGLLDTLAHLEPKVVDRREARLASASAAHDHLGDGSGALTRLGPLLQQGDGDAEELARDIARATGLGRELAQVYITKARQAPSPSEAESSWRMVVKIHDEWLSDPAEAFEAALRLLAGAPQSREHLSQVDRLAVKLNAWQRLSSVYARLIRAASSDNERVELNLRLSSLLEQHEQGALALEFAMNAARNAPSDTRLLQRVERLAASLSSPNEELWAQEQRATLATEPRAALEAWIDAARTADLALQDREQANVYLRRALALTQQVPDGAEPLSRLSEEMDAARPELGAEDARRALLRAHLELAEQADDDFRVTLILSASRFARDVLRDERACFDVLRGGAAAPPFPEPLLDALQESAIRIQRLDALDAQLARSAERSEAPADKQRLLRRRARLLVQQLQRYDQAANVYDRLLELAPDDAELADAQLDTLRRAGRHRELLRACERRLTQLQDAQAKLRLMREMAQIWEIELKNKASALAIWTDVHTLSPRDEEASQALERLRASEAR